MSRAAYARLVAGATLVLLFAGALVTSTGSGLAVPDWPTTFGKPMYEYPLSEMKGGVAYEHAHRMLAGILGLLAAVLAVWVGLKEPRRWVKGLAAAALFAVVVQGVLGGLTVLLGLPPVVSIAHALLGTTFFVLVFLVAAVSSRRWREAEVPPRDGVLLGFFAALTAAVVLQIGLGGLLRHASGAGFPQGGVTAHIVGAVLVFALAGLVLARSPKGVLRRIGTALVHMVVFQVLLGFGALAAGRGGGVFVRSLHLVVGSLIYAYAALGLLWSLRAFSAERVGRVLADAASLTKARLVLLVAATAAAGHLIEAGPTRLTALLLLVAGTTLLAAGAAAANEVLEADLDRRMPRTRNRPVAAGRISPRAGGIVAAVLTLGGLLLLAPVGAAVFAMGVFAWGSYLFVYTPAKRASILNTLIGALPGAAPILMGSLSGAGGDFTPLGVNLFALLYVWQIPHFLALAWLYRDEFRNAGLAMLGAGEGEGGMLIRQAVLGVLALVPISLFPVVHAGAGWAYALPALFAGGFFLAQGARLAARPTAVSARGLFRYSIAYCPAILAVLFLERWF